jgi:hypothetical protein
MVSRSFDVAAAVSFSHLRTDATVAGDILCIARFAVQPRAAHAAAAHNRHKIAPSRHERPADTLCLSRASPRDCKPDRSISARRAVPKPQMWLRIAHKSDARFLPLDLLDSLSLPVSGRIDYSWVFFCLFAKSLLISKYGSNNSFPFCPKTSPPGQNP